MAAHHKCKLQETRASVYSNTIFLDVAKGSDFEDDVEMQNHLDMLSNTFMNMIETENGRVVLQSLEGVVKLIKDKHTFVSAIQLTSQIVQKLDIDSRERFGLFLGCIGIIIALVSHPGPATPVSTELESIIFETYQLILYTALVPFWNGTRNSVENFFSCGFVDALKCDS